MLSYSTTQSSAQVVNCLASDPGSTSLEGSTDHQSHSLAYGESFRCDGLVVLGSVRSLLLVAILFKKSSMEYFLSFNYKVRRTPSPCPTCSLEHRTYRHVHFLYYCDARGQFVSCQKMLLRYVVYKSCRLPTVWPLFSQLLFLRSLELFEYY